MQVCYDATYVNDVISEGNAFPMGIEKIEKKIERIIEKSWKTIGRRRYRQGRRWNEKKWKKEKLKTVIALHSTVDGWMDGWKEGLTLIGY